MTNPHNPNSLDKLQRAIVIIVGLPLCGCLLCAAYTFVPIIMQEIAGQLGLHLYRNARYIYDYQAGYGSGSRGDRILFYWTEDSLEEVRHFYEGYFPLEIEKDGLWIEGYSQPVTIYLIDASQYLVDGHLNPDTLIREWVFPYSSALQASIELGRVSQRNFFYSVHPGGTMIIYKYPLNHWD